MIKTGLNRSGQKGGAQLGQVRETGVLRTMRLEHMCVNLPESELGSYEAECTPEMAAQHGPFLVFARCLAGSTVQR